MGGMRFMRNDPGTPRTKEFTAFELTIFWFIGGLPICFLISIIIFQSLSLSIPFWSYIIIEILLVKRYFRLDKQALKNEEKKAMKI